MDPPLFFEGGTLWKQAQQVEEVFTFGDTETTGEQQMFLVSDAQDEALFYYSPMSVVVCANGECKLAEINMFWSLIGDYWGYGIVKDAPLTKYEHAKFEAADYAKLHKLLANKNSVFRHKTLDELIDKVPTDNPLDLDATSGATKEELKAEVVAGGAYSCYSLWHLAHDPVVLKHIKNSSSEYFAKNGFAKLLDSDIEQYQAYALRQIPASDLGVYESRLAELFTTATPQWRVQLLKKLPQKTLVTSHFKSWLYAGFYEWDTHSQNNLLQKLDETMMDQGLEILREYDRLNENQIRLLVSKVVLWPSGKKNKFIEAIPLDKKGDNPVADYWLATLNKN
ncbi:hypothetical protein [Sediminicola luteus]|nr:hypothetical protein [Sediminicola luteus]